MRRLIGLVWLPLLVVSGCGFFTPELYEITGKVTLDGKSYNRLIVYFSPVSGTKTDYNLGVGETDGQGRLRMRSIAGSGIAAGKYRVSFSCVMAENAAEIDPNEKLDDQRNVKIEELVPEPYVSEDESPVEFQVIAGQDNVFEFDIPAKK
jgi:hypothetical protein